jgi:6-phosphofructokinase 1
MEIVNSGNLEVPTLGPCTIESPLQRHWAHPGLNDVIRGLVLQAYDRYGIRKVYGIRCGYEGLIKAYGHRVLELTPDDVKNIHMLGGSILGTSRGPQDAKEMVDRLAELGVNALFIIGGDGTLRGAVRIVGESQSRRHPISVVGIPKTIDNDILFTDKSFGYETACAAAVQAIKVAHTETRSVRKCPCQQPMTTPVLPAIAAWTALCPRRAQ